MTQSKRQREIEARRAADPIAQLMDRVDVDYSSDDLPTAPWLHHGVERRVPLEPQTDAPVVRGQIIGWEREAKYPASVLDDLFVAQEITFEQYERLRQENK